MSNLAYHNMAQWCYSHHLRFAAKVFGRCLRHRNQCEIPYSAKIDKSVVFAHKGLGVVIGTSVSIGAGTKILQNVTIGGRDDHGGNVVIGENVLIGAGAIIIGSLHIGNNAKIGAGAVVLHDVPDNVTAVGNPARLIYK